MKKCLFISCIFLFGQFLFAQRNFAEAEEAFRNKNYKSAENYFKTISNRDSSYAEAQYMLAKIYFESDYKSIRKSMAFINAALLVKPNELRYLVAKLELLRSPSNNYISEILKDAQRRDISRKILKIDAQNAFANEELGNTYMKDYVRFKNAFSVVNVDAYEGRTETAPRRFNAFDSNEKMNEFGGEGTIGDKPNPFVFANSLEGAQVESQNELNKIIQQQIDITKLGDLSQTDQFDLELLKSLGIPITDLSARSVLAYQKAVEYFTIAKNSDPLRRSVYTQLMQIYFEKEDWKEALDLSKNMYGFFPEDEMTWLYLGATQFYMKDYENAARSFETAKKYLKPELIEAFDDISLLLRKNDLPKYQADKEGYRQRFWNAQNPRFLTTYNERNLEHYARITYADLITAAPKVEKRGWETVRGQVIIRYGKPKINVIMEKTNRMVSQGYVDGEINYLNDRNYNNNLQLDKFISVENPTHLYNIWKYDGFSFVFFDALKNNNYQLYSPTADEATLGIDVAKSDYQMIADELFAKTPEVYQ